MTAEQTIFDLMRHRKHREADRPIQADRTIQASQQHSPSMMGSGVHADSMMGTTTHANGTMLVDSAISNGMHPSGTPSNGQVNNGMLLASSAGSATETMFATTYEMATFKATLMAEVNQLKQAMVLVQQEFRQKYDEKITDLPEFKQQQAQNTADIADLKFQLTLARFQQSAEHANEVQLLKQRQETSGVEHHQQQEKPKEAQREKHKDPLENPEPSTSLEVRDADHLEEAAPEKEEKTGRQLTFSRLAHYHKGYELEESIWDSSIFLGFACVGKLTWVIIVLGILLTIAMEGSFILVVWANYNSHGLDDDMLDGLLHWRAVVAHDVKNYDPASQTSLAARVCAHETSTDLSAFQMFTHRDVEEFRRSPIQGVNGYYLCNLALILWFFSIVHDCILNIRFTCVILTYAYGTPSLVDYGDEIKVVSLGKLQVFFTLNLVTLPRFIIAVFLGYAGTFFLCYTSKLNDLLLNAVALVFVLDIDEMLFYALLPTHVKIVMRTLEPLHSPEQEDSGAGTCIRTVKKTAESLTLRVVIVILLVLACNFEILGPFTDHLDLAMKYLCSGDKDIVFTRNQVSQLIFYSKAPTYDAKDVHKMTYNKRAVLEVIGLNPELYRKKVGDLPNAFEYWNSSIDSDMGSLVRKAFGNRFYAASTAMCIDHTDLDALNKMFPGKKAQQFYQATELKFRDMLQDPSFKSCSELDLKSQCAKKASARSLCGRHCGCDTPWLGLFSATTTAGCAGNCDPRWQLNLYYETPPEIATYTDRCEDVPVEVLEQQQSWNNYVYGLSGYLLQYEPEQVVQVIVHQLHQRGCGYLTAIRFLLDICTPNDMFRSARYYCPATCMCANSDQKECPDSCKYALPHQTMSPGLACPLGLEITSTSECEVAADEILQRVKQIDYEPEDVPSGCYLSHGKLIFASGSDEYSIPSDYVSLCKAAQPFLPNEVSKGKFELGKHCADCILHDMECANECYYGPDASTYPDAHGSGGHRLLSEGWTMIKNGTKETGQTAVLRLADD